jgi:hypothetical protein
MREALAERAMPTITLWNRLEPQPRADDFSRALKAEARDALWMLTKQWQMGEFAGDDACSPVLARMHLTRTTLTKYQAGDGPVQSFDRTTPLESQVERRPIPFARAGGDVSLDIRLAMGCHWLKLVADLGDFTADFAARYPVRTPDQDKAADAPSAAHAESYQVFRAARRLMDRYKLYLYLAGDPAHRAYDGIPALAGLEAAIAARSALPRLVPPPVSRTGPRGRRLGARPTRIPVRLRRATGRGRGRTHGRGLSSRPSRLV